MLLKLYKKRYKTSPQVMPATIKSEAERSQGISKTNSRRRTNGMAGSGCASPMTGTITDSIECTLNLVLPSRYFLSTLSSSHSASYLRFHRYTLLYLFSTLPFFYFKLFNLFVWFLSRPVYKPDSLVRAFPVFFYFFFPSMPSLHAFIIPTSISASSISYF